MDYFGIIKRALEITWKHKSLWLFGFLSALFQSGSRVNYQFDSQDVQPEKVRGLERIVENLFTPLVIVILIVVVLFAIALSIIVSFLSQAALIGMVDDVEKRGQTSVNEGFSRGWSNWLSLFGMNLSIWIPFSIFAILLIVLLIGPSVASFILKQVVLGIVLVVIGIFALLILLIPTGIGLSLVEILAQRYRIIQKRGIFESISEGYNLIRSNLGKVFIFWLIMLLVGMAVGIALIPVSLLLLAPVFALLFWNVFLALLLGIPGGLVITFISGLVATFASAAWTEFFLELTPSEVSDIIVASESQDMV